MEQPFYVRILRPPATLFTNTGPFLTTEELYRWLDRHGFERHRNVWLTPTGSFRAFVNRKPPHRSEPLQPPIYWTALLEQHSASTG